MPQAKAPLRRRSSPSSSSARRNSVAVLRVDPIVDLDQHRSAIVGDRLAGARRLIVERTGVRSIASACCSRHRQVSGIAERRAPIAASSSALDSPVRSGDLSPDRAADRHRAENHGEKHRKSATAHPVGQHRLRRDVEARQHHHPGRAGDQRGREHEREIGRPGVERRAPPRCRASRAATIQSRLIRSRSKRWRNEPTIAPALIALSRKP